ncbi:MAG TPA: hypothetical protein VHZ06_01550 [Marmoricola sp.]|nr:hypothetical protein [Marmoricola sp.]
MATVRSIPPLPRRWYGVYAMALLVSLIALAALLVPGRADAAPVAASGSSTNLVGLLKLTPGSCSGGHVTGTYLRMVLPSGGANGPYMSNNDSRCSDQSYTPLAPGTDGGLEFGSYQPTPSPAFNSTGDALAHRITDSTGFYGTNFALGTSKVDPQTKISVPAPRLTVTGSVATADLRAFAVTWNNQNFNQGAPKPNGSTPGNTRVATGTYNAATGALTLNWASQVVGGPFDKFTGSWHFEGTFVPAGRTAGATTSHTTGSTTGSTTTTGTTTTGTGGAALTPGGPTAAGTAAPKAGTEPASAVGTSTTTAAAPGTIKTVTTQKWHVSKPVVGLAIGIALVGFGALVMLSVLTRREAGTA